MDEAVEGVRIVRHEILYNLFEIYEADGTLRAVFGSEIAAIEWLRFHADALRASERQGEEGGR